VADTPSQPSPEILEKLRQLREELAQKAAQQAPKDANTLAWQQSNAFKRIYPRANGGQIKAKQSDPEIDALFQEPSLTMDERFRKYVAPNVREGLNNGLDAMLPMRGLAREAFKKGVFLPVANFYKKNANDLDDADVKGKVEEYKRMKEMELRNKIGLRQLPVEYDLSKFSRRLEPNSFPNPDNPIEVPKNLERDWTELLMQPKAKGGVIDMDRMRLELMNKAKGGSVMGVNVASDRKHNLNYADLIVDGHKTIESRNSDTLRPYVGKRVAIVRTGAGKAKAIGEVTIGEPIVANKKQFRNMESHHLVPEGSTFDIKTPTKHMYPLSEPVRYDEERDVGHGILSRKVIHKDKGGKIEVRPTVFDDAASRRNPKIEAAARALMEGEMTNKAYEKLVAKEKPVKPYDFIPRPATDEEALSALDVGKKPKWRGHESWPAGHRVGLRLDIPSYEHHGVWVNSVHDESGNKEFPTSYGPVSSVRNAEFQGAPSKAVRVATGEQNKAPFAKIMGELEHMTEEQAVKHMQKYFKHPDYRQIGYDPRRHGDFYDRETMEPVTHSEHVVQIGPLVLAKKPKYGKREVYAKGGTASMAKGGSRIVSMKEIEDYIRQKRGEHASKRVQRAADEIPGLENMYTPEALQHTFERQNAGLMSMNPADFEKFAERMREDITRKDSKRKTRNDEVLPFDSYLNHLAQLKGGFDEVPFLELGHRDPEYLPSIEGHEGRHRSRALSGRGVKKSLVQLMPAARLSMSMPKRNSEKLVQKLNQTLGKDRFVSPEGGGLLPSDQTAGMYNWLREKKLLEANRPQLPEVYKSGGATHAHHLDIEERPL
jgi:hypothetical protein